MSLVEAGTHPKWTGGFVTNCVCGHCHVEGNRRCYGWNVRGEKLTPCRCKEYTPEETHGD